MISLYDILEASNGQLFGEPRAQIFTRFRLDPALAMDGDLFLALRTDRGDTHQYISEAIANGASGVICTRPPETNTEGVSVVLVRDTVDALLAWSHYVLRKMGIKVIAVSGSMGKSVAVDAISRVLGTRYNVHTDDNDYDGKLGVPLALAGINSRHDFAVLKLATTYPGEMAAMVQAVQPTVGVLTHIGDLNTNTFESPTDILAEQGVLMESLTPTELAVLNFDSAIIRSLAKEARAQIQAVGIDTFDVDIMAYNLVIGLDGTGFDLRYGGGGERSLAHRIPILGRHHIYSVLAALLVGKYYDIPITEGAKVLGQLSPLPGRMNPLIGHANSLLIDDTYNANTESTLSALSWLKAIRESVGRTIFILGEMNGSASRIHNGYRMVGQQVAEIADIFIAQGTEPAQSTRAALDMGMDPNNVRTTHSAPDTVSLLKRTYELNDNDLVLVKGNIASQMEHVVQALIQEHEPEKDQTRTVAVVPRIDVKRTQRIVFSSTRLSWVEIDTSALSNNIRNLKQMVGDDVHLMAVVKTDAYGHGAVAVSQIALLNGASYLGVSSMIEALELREAGIQAPILVMNYSPAHLVRQAIAQNITLTLYDLDLARAYDRAAREISGKLRVHIKVDSGMGRLGMMPRDSVSMFRHLLAMQNLEIEGIYTHFSMADEDPDYTAKQLEEFRNIFRPIQATTGIKFKYIHAANSAATLSQPDTHLNMVRTGLAMYGLHPSAKVALPDTFLPALTWKTSIAQVKTLPEGHPVGYGNTYITQKAERVAVIPVGYGEGFRRAPQHWGEVLVQGKRAPIIGRVSMEKTVISVDHLSGVSIGDEVVLLGTQGSGVITAEEIADRLGTINYEVITGILPRVPRD